MIFEYLNGLPGVQEASNTGVHSPGVPGLPDQQQLVIGLITHTDHSHWCCDGISHVTTVTTPAPGSGHWPDMGQSLAAEMEFIFFVSPLYLWSTDRAKSCLAGPRQQGPALKS